MDLTEIARNYVMTNTLGAEKQPWLSEIEWAKIIDDVSVDENTLMLHCRDDVPRWSELAALAGKQIRSWFTICPPTELLHLDLIRVIDRSNNLVAKWTIGELPDGRSWSPRITSSEGQ